MIGSLEGARHGTKFILLLKPREITWGLKTNRFLEGYGRYRDLYNKVQRQEVTNVIPKGRRWCRQNILLESGKFYRPPARPQVS